MIIVKPSLNPVSGQLIMAFSMSASPLKLASSKSGIH
jgi:hypothetical protein